MPDDKLARLEPQVRTLARPDAGPLLSSRHNIQRSPEAQDLFKRARAESWTAEQLAEQLQPVLQERVEGTNEQIAASARYLADEYLQIGDAVLLISTQTGKAIARVTDEDIWQPEPVPREGGGRMARPLPRLRPELEGFLVEWVFNTSKEEALTASLSRRVTQTDLLRQEGDQRLLPVTKGGRKHIVTRVEEALPTLLGECQGLTKEFLSHFELRSEDPPGLEPLLRCVAIARTLTPITDPTTFNLRHDHFTALSSRIPSQWVREFARSLAVAAHQRASAEPISYRNVALADLSSAQFWVAEPDTVQALYTKNPSSAAFPVEGAPTTGLNDKVGAIVIDPASYACRSREFHSRWEIVAKVEYVLWVDWTKIRTLNLDGVPTSGLSVEVLDRTR